MKVSMTNMQHRAHISLCIGFGIAPLGDGRTRIAKTKEVSALGDADPCLIYPFGPNDWRWRCRRLQREAGICVPGCIRGCQGMRAFDQSGSHPGVTGRELSNAREIDGTLFDDFTLEVLAFCSRPVRPWAPSGSREASPFKAMWCDGERSQLRTRELHGRPPFDNNPLVEHVDAVRLLSDA